MIYLDLILNLSLLVALSVISGFIDQRWPRNTRMGMVLQGALFGGAAILGMLRPFQHGPGLIFDGRSVMVSLCALYFGPWSALIAGGATAVCRLSIGGVGTIMGVMVIASSVMIGLLVHHHCTKKKENLSTWGLYVFGLAVHLAMIGLMATLPSQAALTALRQVGLPIILLYPLATILVGKILSDQESKIRFIADLQRTRQNMDTTLRSIADAVVSTDLKGDIILMNPVAETLTGWSAREALNRPIGDVFRLVEPNSNAPIPPFRCHAAARENYASGRTQSTECHDRRDLPYRRQCHAHARQFRGNHRYSSGISGCHRRIPGARSTAPE